MNLVLSLFPGIDLLGKAFEEEGFCIVRGPDVIWGGDIRNFHPPSGVFEGVIGGPPCQVFSKLKYLNPLAGSKHGNLIPEFERVVVAAHPDWWVCENVLNAPLPSVPHYHIRNLILDNRWVGGIQQRRRRFTLGFLDKARAGAMTISIVLFEEPNGGLAPTTVLAGHGPVGRGGKKWTVTPPISEISRLQGLPEDFLDDSPFTTHGKRQLIGNGVPLPLGRAIAKAIKENRR